MDWETRLMGYSLAELQAMRRNADEQMRLHPGTKKATDAEERLELIDREQARRSMPGNIDTFRAKYPMGFKDRAYLHEERDEKVKAHELCNLVLARNAFVKARETEATAGLIDAVKQVIGKTNLIQGSFEKPKFLEAIRDERNSRPFLDALEDLLYGPGEPPERLERFSAYMHTLGLRKWTYGTYFLFLSDPKNCMFVKPEGLKKAVDIACYPLEYDAEPTAALYRDIMGFARWIESKLRDANDPHLVPEGMIDVQSFIWHMAPTGKWSK